MKLQTTTRKDNMQVSINDDTNHLTTIQILKAAIEDTGSTFCDRDTIFREHGINDLTQLVMDTSTEYSDPPPRWWLNFGSISAARLLPVYISWIGSRNANLVVYCPVLCQVEP